eukprot:TRINITY_DN113089_c0_g1_i1.p1 TRINITY_DN113089_c0_g1~~TRINITY_DN113089_c0_g1_i1.p1  ORF type:complete len:456 (-),score=110.98 TRINITY_DN113089_c0_g1_i1:131-1498(-)
MSACAQLAVLALQVYGSAAISLLLASSGARARAEADCTVPTIVGASVTGCVEGATVPHSTKCIWASDDKYTCANVGELTCANGGFSAAPECNMKCTLPSVLGASLKGAADGGDASCVEGADIDHGKECTWSTDDDATCDQEGAVTCTNGKLSLLPTCAAKCTVPAVNGTTIAGTGCVAGAKVVSGTSCTWTAAADNNKTCSNLGAALACDNGKFSKTPICFGPASSDLVNDAKRLDDQVANLEAVVRNTEGSVQQLNVFVGSLADNLTRAAQAGYDSQEMARANAAAGKAFSIEQAKVDAAMANLSSKVTDALNTTAKVQGSIPPNFNFSSVRKALSKLTKLNATFKALSGNSGSADSVAGMAKDIKAFHKKIEDSVNKTVTEINLTALADLREAAVQQYGTNLWLNETRREGAAAATAAKASGDWERLYAPPVRRKALRRRCLYGFGCGEGGQP